MSFTASSAHNRQIMIPHEEKLFTQLIGFSDGLVQAEATSRTRAERSAHLDLAIILHGVEAPCCHPRPRPITWCLFGGSCLASISNTFN